MNRKVNIIDFHSHILPGADHGSDSMETSLWQVNSALSHGVKRIVATPHFYPHSHTVSDFLERRDYAYKQLKKQLPHGIEIIPGAEVLICPGIENLPDIDSLFIKGTKTLLLELPFDCFEECYLDSVNAMVESGIKVVLAHADRYSSLIVEKMIRAGALLQINVSSIVGIKKRREAFSWIKRGVVVALGSDIHGRDKKAYKNFLKAIKSLKNDADYICDKSNSLTKKKKA